MTDRYVLAMMRHETNTFSPIPTDITKFSRGSDNDTLLTGEAAIAAIAAHPTEQEGAEPAGPHHDQHGEQDGPEVTVVGGDQGHQGDGQIRERSGEVIEMLGLGKKRGNEHRDVHPESDDDKPGEGRQPTELLATVTAERSHSGTESSGDNNSDDGSSAR